MSFVNRRGGRGRGGGGGNQSYNSNRRTETNRNPRAPIILAKPQHDHRGGGGRDSNDAESFEQRPQRSENRRQVLARKDSSQGEDPRHLESPRPSPQSSGSSTGYSISLICFK